MLSVFWAGPRPTPGSARAFLSIASAHEAAVALQQNVGEFSHGSPRQSIEGPWFCDRSAGASAPLQRGAARLAASLSIAQFVGCRALRCVPRFRTPEAVVSCSAFSSSATIQNVGTGRLLCGQIAGAVGRIRDLAMLGHQGPDPRDTRMLPMEPAIMAGEDVTRTRSGPNC